MMKKLVQDVSQLFLWGFEGTSLSKKQKFLLKKYPPAGVVLFKRNIQSPQQLKRLTTQLRSIAGKGLLIGIDQEGGRVSRLPEPFLQYPPAATWGILKSPDLAYRIGRFMGEELASVGINLNFAPVLDVNTNSRNPIIGDRAFSKRPKMVIQTAIPFAKGLLAAGVIPCGKHFPGHGDTSSDSHRTLPRVQRPELAPFRAAIQMNIPTLMTAHVVYRSLDPKIPATVSKGIMTHLLRKKLKFRGVLFSDDLLMNGISRKYSLLEAAVLSFEAGVDAFLICRNFEKYWPLIESLAEEIAASPTLKLRLKSSLGRLQRLKKKV